MAAWTFKSIPSSVTVCGSCERRQGEADLLAGQRTDAQMVDAAVRDADGVVLVAEVRGQMVACCQLQLRDGYVYFGMFAVSPARQAVGLGRAVLAEAERVAADAWGAGELRMTVIVQREDLIAWYLRRGYARTGELSPFPYGDERFRGAAAAGPGVRDTDQEVSADEAGCGD